MSKIKSCFFILFVFFFLSCCSKDGGLDCNGGTFTGNIRLDSQIEIDDFAKQCYTKIDGDLTIGHPYQETTVNDLSGLKSITEVTGRFRISYCKDLTTLKGLEGLTYAGGLDIRQNHKLENLTGLNNLIQVGDLIENDTDHKNMFKIHNCYILESITALRNLKAAEGISLLSNYNLASLDGLENLTKVINPSTYYNIEIGAIDLHNSYYNGITDYCALQNLFKNGEYDSKKVSIVSNVFEPTIQNIIDGNCKQ